MSGFRKWGSEMEATLDVALLCLLVVVTAFLFAPYVLRRVLPGQGESVSSAVAVLIEPMFPANASNAEQALALGELIRRELEEMYGVGCFYLDPDMRNLERLSRYVQTGDVIIHGRYGECDGEDVLTVTFFGKLHKDGVPFFSREEHHYAVACEGLPSLESLRDRITPTIVEFRQCTYAAYKSLPKHRLVIPT